MEVGVGVGVEYIALKILHKSGDYWAFYGLGMRLRWIRNLEDIFGDRERLCATAGRREFFRYEKDKT